MPVPSPREILRIAINKLPAGGSDDRFIDHFLDTFATHGARLVVGDCGDQIRPVDLRDQISVLASAMAENSNEAAVVAGKVPHALRVLGYIHCSGHVIAQAPIPAVARS